MITGFATVSVLGIEVMSASEGISAVSSQLRPDDGSILVQDCAFREVWNRSSIGQAIPTPGKRNCYSGWSVTVGAGGFANATVRNCLFDDVDVAFQPLGALQSVSLLGNTITRANGNTVLMVGDTEWLIAGNVFTRNYVPRFFMCGTTDIMVGLLGTTGAISGNELGWRGEHPAGPDGCAIDFEGGSDGVAVTDNLIHDSWGAGVMVFGLSDRTRNISNAAISRNIFVRNGTVRVFRQKFTLEDAIGSPRLLASSDCSLDCSLQASSEASRRVTNGIPLGCLLLLPVHTVNCVQTLKVR
jgi:hypothetical protein